MMAQKGYKSWFDNWIALKFLHEFLDIVFKNITPSLYFDSFMISLVIFKLIDRFDLSLQAD